MSLFALAAAAAVVVAAPSASPGPVETFVEAAGPTGVLKGTMLTPARADARTPVMLVIPGSGPTDRDGNSPLGVKASMYRLLGEGLASRGVASVRIDKRGMFASLGDPNVRSLDDYAADLAAWTRSLRAKTGAPCIWLFGHSEGGLVALVAAQSNPNLCGVVLASTPGRPLGEVLRAQLGASPQLATRPDLRDRALAGIAALERGETVDPTGLPPGLAGLFAPKVQDFLRDMVRRDPVALLKAYKGPVLVLQGTTDLQVSSEDADRLAAARPGVGRVDLPGVNHVLKVAPAERAANIASYADPSLPLAPGVAESIAAFVKAPAR